MTEPNYVGLSDHKASIARFNDRGVMWRGCDASEKEWGYPSEYHLAWRHREAMHDRDRFQRERDWWREECIKLTGEALA